MRKVLVFSIVFLTCIFQQNSKSYAQDTNSACAFYLPQNERFGRITEEIGTSFEHKFNLSNLQKASLMSVVSDYLKNINLLKQTFKNDTVLYREHFSNYNKSALNSINNILGKAKSTQLKNCLTNNSKGKKKYIQELFTNDSLSKETLWVLQNILTY